MIGASANSNNIGRTHAFETRTWVRARVTANIVNIREFQISDSNPERSREGD